MKREVVNSSFFTVIQSAALIGCSQAILYDWISQGRVVTCRFGGITFLPEAEIERQRKLWQEKAAPKEALARTQTGPVLPIPDLRPHVAPWCSSLRIAGKSAATIDLYRGQVQKLLEPCPDPGRNQILAYLGARVAEVGPSALSTTIKAVKSFYKYLHTSGVIHEDPAAQLVLPRMPHKERVVPPTRDIAMVLALARENPRDAAMIMILAGSGLRVSELTGLRVKNLNMERRLLQVTGKGNKQRSVPITEETAEALDCYMRTLGRGSPWLFPGYKGQALTTMQVDTILRNLCRRAGVDNISPHQFRHYAASSLLTRKVPLKIVSEILGHATPSITANTYWHILDRADIDRAYRESNVLGYLLAEERLLENGSCGCSNEGGENGKSGRLQG